MRKPETKLHRPDPARAQLVATLYSLGHHDLGDQTQDHIDDPMGAWDAWVGEGLEIMKKRTAPRVMVGPCLPEHRPHLGESCNDDCGEPHCDALRTLTAALSPAKREEAPPLRQPERCDRCSEPCSDYRSDADGRTCICCAWGLLTRAREERDALRAAVEEARRFIAIDKPAHIHTRAGISDPKGVGCDECERWWAAREALTAALSPAQGEKEVDPRDAEIARLRDLVRSFTGEVAEHFDSGEYDEDQMALIGIGIDLGRQAEPNHPCTRCGGSGWWWQDTPGGEFDTILRRCDHEACACGHPEDAGTHGRTMCEIEDDGPAAAEGGE